MSLSSMDGEAEERMPGRHMKAAKEAARVSPPTFEHKIGHESSVEVTLRGALLTAMPTNFKVHDSALFDDSPIQPN